MRTICGNDVMAVWLRSLADMPPYNTRNSLLYSVVMLVMDRSVSIQLIRYSLPFAAAGCAPVLTQHCKLWLAK